MRLRTRFVLLIALAALAPLALLGGVAIKVSTTRVVAKVTEVQGRTASAVADHVAGWLELQLDLIARQVSTFDYLATGKDPERAAFLRLIYSQNPVVQIAALVDSTGSDLAPPVALAVAGSGSLTGRDAINDARMQRFRADLMAIRKVTPPGRVGFGEPILPAGRSSPVVVVGARLSSGATVGVELSLQPLASRFDADLLTPQEGVNSTASAGAAGSFDSESLVLLSAQNHLVLGDGRLLDAAVVGALPDGMLEDIRYTLNDGTEVLSALADVGGTGWKVLVSEPLASTQSSAKDIVQRTAYVMGVAALISVVLGVIVSRQITGPVEDLRAAALAVAEGQFGRRVDSLPGGGELTELTHAFNFMSRRLDQDRTVIAAKNVEIEVFNRELQARVDQRTAQLRQAQGKLVHAARLAAVGEMGAGLAHELNNPLAGILGLAQVLAARSPSGSQAQMLASIEEQTRRCTKIVMQMQRFSQLDPTGPDLDLQASDVVNFSVVVDEVLGLVRSAFVDSGVTVDCRLAPGLDVRGDRGALAQALTQLLTSLRAAATPGAQLSVTGEIQDGQVLIQLCLDGGELRVGQDDWMASGLGFWTARQVFSAHGGRLEEPSTDTDTDIDIDIDTDTDTDTDIDTAAAATSSSWVVRLPRA